MKTRFLFVLLLCLSSLISAYSNHLKGGNISVNHVEANTYQISMHVYIKTLGEGTNVPFSHDDSGILDFGDGSLINIQESAGVVRLDLDPSGATSEVTINISHTYAASGGYHISYQEANRNEGILNFDNSVMTPFYIESFLIVDPLQFAESPVLLADPILKVPLGQLYSYSLAVKATNDNSIFYHIETPRQSVLQYVSNYKLPENFKINNLTGLITWDTKFQNASVAGLYSFALKIIQVRDNKIVGYTIQDFQLEVVDPIEKTLGLSDDQNLVDQKIFIAEGSLKTIKVFAEAAGSTLQLKAYSEFTDGSDDLFSFSTKDSVTEDARNINVGTIKIKSTADIIRNNPYNVIIRAGYDNIFFKDISYSIYTKDIELTEPNLVTAIDPEKEIELKVFPNPVTDILTIENPNREKLIVKITSLAGVLMVEKQSNQNVTIDMRTCVPGIYILNASQGNRKHIVKILKK